MKREKKDSIKKMLRIGVIALVCFAFFPAAFFVWGYFTAKRKIEKTTTIRISKPITGEKTREEIEGIVRG